jgi:voltage-gated potassium channel
MRRGQISAFIERHNTAWELSLAALAVVYLGVGSSIDEGRGAPTFIIGGLAVIFLTEFGVRFWDAPSRRLYLRGHWLDLVSCIPLVGGVRGLRILRLLRLGAALRIFSLAEHEAEAHQRHDSWWFLGPVLVVFWLGASAAYWSLEHGVNPSLHTFGDALYWSFITATTVGYGDITPTTPEGRILAGVLIFVGIGLVGFASAQLTQRLMHSDLRAQAATSRRLDAIDEQIRGLREDLRPRRK